MINSITSNLLWTQGWAILATLGAIAVIGLLWWRPLVFLCLGLFIFSFYFFRNPERICVAAQTDSNIIVCPADGKIIDLLYDSEKLPQGFAQKISIFLSPIDVHVNWIPLSGTIEKITYTAGSFLPAFLPKSSESNEHLDVLIKNDRGQSLMVRQIAGFIARRICWWVKEGDAVRSGDKYGMIRFGSRVDVFVPKNVEVLVGLGQRVYGGQTALARWQ